MAQFFQPILLTVLILGFIYCIFGAPTTTDNVQQTRVGLRAKCDATHNICTGDHFECRFGICKCAKGYLPRMDDGDKCGDASELLKSVQKAEAELEGLKKSGEKGKSGVPAAFSALKPAKQGTAEEPRISDNANSIRDDSGENQKRSLREYRTLGEPQIDLGLPVSPLQAENGPRDIAEYIFWTGDEASVIGSISDFIRDGIIGQREAIGFLEDIKRELDILENANRPVLGNRQKKMYREMGSFGDRALPFENLGTPQETIEPQEVALTQLLDEFNEKVREGALEDVIYTLSKELFSREIELEGLRNIKGPHSTHTIQNLVQMVEEKSAQGLLPKDLQRSVIDSLISGLMDAASERGMIRDEAPKALVKPNPQLQLQSLKSKKTLKI